MHACSHIDNVIPFAMRQMSALEEAEFETHLSGCACCRLKVSEVIETVDLMACAAPPAPLPPGLKEKVIGVVALEAKAASRGARKRRWVLPAWAGAAAVFALMVSSYSLVQLKSLRAQMELGAPVERMVAIMGTTEAPGANGRVLATREGGSTRISLQALGLPPLQPGQAYQLWLLKDGARTSGGVFVVDAAGKGGVVSWLPGDVTFDTVGISREPDALGMQPRGPKVMGSSI